MTAAAIARRALAAGALALALVAPAAAQEQSESPLADKGYAMGDVVMGEEDAPVTIIEYASLTCPHCASFHQDAFPEIKRDYIDTGKAKLILREIYFDQFGLWATMLARCGGEDNYHGLIDTLLSTQQQWFGAHARAFQQTNNPKPIVDELFRIGRRAGLSNQRMTGCLQDEAFLNALVERFKQTSGEDDVDSTPTFLVNGERVKGAVSATRMSEVIESKL